jgi:glycosyltransferase involved in cell wall biosynthesis
MLVPLRVGGGSRLKILEAMATATPVLSTSVGAEGLRVQAGKNLLLQDTETDFAQAAVAMIRNPEDYQDLAEEGRRLVLREYDWEPLALKLEEVWTVAVEQKEVKPATPG